MNAKDALRREFEPVRARFLSSPPVTRLMHGTLTLAHYQGILREIFHHTRENPQLQALATVWFRGAQRSMVRPFFRHALSEVGHDQLALDDLKALGYDVARLPFETPLPATSALLGFGFYQIYNLNPVGYLGYLYFLEFTPTSSGSAFMDALERVGVPRAAMSFLRDHTTVDVGHNLMMEQYVETLVRGRRELDAVVYAMQTTGYLYAQMLNAAIADAEAPAGRQARHEEARGSAYFDDDLVPVGVPART